MKGLMQAVALMLVVLAAILGWRIVSVVSIQPPLFSQEPVQLRGESLRPAPTGSAATGPVIKAILDGNLFETERGYREDIIEVETQVALPPPTNIVLNGVISISGQPVAIMNDTKLGNAQLSVSKGDMIGDYEVGEVMPNGVILLGAGGQQFSVGLQVRKGPGVRARTRAAAARPTTRATSTSRATTAAERASTASAWAARAAATRPPTAARTGVSRSIPRGRPAGAGEVEKPETVTSSAAQARLEALKRLRQAATQAR